VQNSDGSIDGLVAANLPLVGYHVCELLGRVPAYVSRNDLASAGSLALVQAAQAYDPSTGVPFARYAALRIRGALLDELRSMDWVSRGARQRARRVSTTSDVEATSRTALKASSILMLNPVVRDRATTTRFGTVC